MSSPLTAKASMHRKLLGAVCAAVSFLAFSPAAHAVILAPGTSSTALTGTYSLTGETLIHSQSNNFSDTVGGLVFAFTLTTDVYSNPFTGGTDFVYQLFNTAPNDPTGDFFHRLTVSSFANYSVDADYQAGSGNVAPWEVDRSSGTGVVVGFDFSQSPINPQQTSHLLIVRTNSSTYQNGSATVIDNGQGSVVVNVPFGSVVGTPEPASLGILAASLGLLVRRRRGVK